MTAEGIKATAEGVKEEEIDYTPGLMAQACFDNAQARGCKKMRLCGGPFSIVQGILDEEGKWHYYRGT